jgi:5-methylcytosine-specific restriction enzyme subunit McrC
MYAYSKKYRTEDIWLLYPKNDEIPENTKIQFDSGDGTKVQVFFVDVVHIEESLEKLIHLL